MATMKNNISRVDPLRHVEPVLHEEEERARQTRVPVAFVMLFGKPVLVLVEKFSRISIVRKTRAHSFVSI